ncbi:Thioredoxin [bioreactor metagenome]|uniref:Thioredoxin n=1 Tax=bioreactor metagenome TaxID=1076179 RepID=A0A644ZGB9_9ZZZZ
MSEKLIPITKENYEQEVKQSQLPVLLDFWGPKCVPCMGLMPTVEDLAEAYDGKVKFCKVNTAENRRLAIQLRVMSLPTFQFYKNGEVVAELQGSFGRDEIEEKLQALIE